MSLLALAKWYRNFFSPHVIPDPKVDLSKLPTIALSIQPPWSHVFFWPFEGAKDIENRNWNYLSAFRGTVFVHASRRFDFDGYTYIKRAFPAIKMPEAELFQRGGIVGMFDIVDVVSSHTSPWYSGSSTAFVVANAVPLPYFSCKGMLNFWNASEANRHYKEVLK